MTRVIHRAWLRTWGETYLGCMRHLALLLVIPLAGCLVESGPPTRTVVRERSCPPAHHWEGGACVHNGHAYGHYKKDRD